MQTLQITYTEVKLSFAQATETTFRSANTGRVDLSPHPRRRQPHETR